MDEVQKAILNDNPELFKLGEDAYRISDLLTKKFNERGLSLGDLTPSQRIFLFFWVRAVKTYSSISLLCAKGYGQDVATLLRSLLENMIAIKFILNNPKTADSLAVRFVEYKWIIFKRYLPEEEQRIKKASYEIKEKFYKKSRAISEKVEEFKKKYQIVSDKALITWSGHSIRDMAKMAGHELLEEYDYTFRLCSRFAHSSILGDKDYVHKEEDVLILSSVPSSVGVFDNLKNAIKYLVEFLMIFNNFYSLDHMQFIDQLKSDLNSAVSIDKDRKNILPESPLIATLKTSNQRIVLQF